MPSPILTVLRSLSFGTTGEDHLAGLSDSAWQNLLPLTDRSQLTLPLGARCRASLPSWVRARIERDLSNNAIRHERALQAYGEVARALTSRGVQFMVVKGFTQWPFYCDSLSARPQYDLDIYCPDSDIQTAFKLVRELGYEPFRPRPWTTLDHLVPLIRKTGWRPGRDYYDPEMPFTVELHFQFWDRAAQHFDVHGGDRFWGRRRIREIAGMAVPTLDPVDALSYTAWHLIRHLLYSDLRAYHVYELAHFLARTAAHDDFWRDWREAQPAPLVESVAFRLAMEWFQCRPNPVAQKLAHELPYSVESWFDLFRFSALTAMERPNKDDLFLHLALVQSSRDRLKIARRRLLPLYCTPPTVDAHVPSPSTQLRWKRRLFGFWFLAKRVFYHARTIFAVIRSGLRWRSALDRRFRALRKEGPASADRIQGGGLSSGKEMDST
jgi:hypothetical protein